jgi:hypothetical protein
VSSKVGTAAAYVTRLNIIDNPLEFYEVSYLGDTVRYYKKKITDATALFGTNYSMKDVYAYTVDALVLYPQIIYLVAQLAIIEAIEQLAAPLKGKHELLPHFAFMGNNAHLRYTEEERRTRTKTYHGRDSVLEYLKQCIFGGGFVELEDGRNGLESVDINIPHPFKIGDLLEHIQTGEVYVVQDVETGNFMTKRSKYMLNLWYISKAKYLCYEYAMELTDLRFWYTERRRPLPKEKVFLYTYGKFLKGKKPLRDLLNGYAKAAQQGHIYV